MIKRIAFVCRNPSLSVDEFHARWRGPHAELFAKNAAVQDHVLRYEQNHRKPRDYDRTDTPYDGAVIQWFESMDAVREMRSDSRWDEVKADVATLLDVDKTLEVFTGNEQIVIDGPDVREEPLTKLVCGVRKKPGMDRDDVPHVLVGGARAAEPRHARGAEVLHPLRAEPPAPGGLRAHRRARSKA